MTELEQVFIESKASLRAWLVGNYQLQESVWLVRWKKAHTHAYITYDDIVDELICFGWVDSLPRNLDEERTMLRISPRNPKSNWSKINKDRVDKLEKEQRLHSNGKKLIAIAKENGAWDFLNDVEQLVIPPDLQSALEAYPKAAYFYDRFPPSSKRGILEWIKNAKQSSTREKRILETVRKAEQNIKANHPKGRDAGPKGEYPNT